MENLEQVSVFDKQDGCDEPPHVAEVWGHMPEDLDLHVWQLLERTALAHPHREAIVSAWQPQQLDGRPPASSINSRSCLRWTYRELLHKSQLMASALEEAGFRSGMRLGALLWNSAEWALLFWATARMGVTFVPIDPRHTTEARRMLRMVQPDLVVVQDEQAASIVNGYMAADSSTLTRIQCAGPLGEGWLSLHPMYAKAVEGAHVHPEDVSGDQKRDLNAAVLIIFTSGTSGMPKGCVHKSRNIISQTTEYDPNEDSGDVDRWLVHTPVSHMFAINNMLRAWRLGDAVVLPSKMFDVNLTIRALVDEACTIMSATPTLVKALIDHPSFPGADAVKLNLVTIAATTVRMADVRLCRDKLGAKDSIQAYGMSEGAPLISWARTDDKIREGFHPGVGRVLPGAALRICQPGSRKVLARNEVGELHVSGPSVIDEYLDDVDPKPLYDGSSARWLKTGDQAMIDSEGIVHILGRYKDIIIRGGENINPCVIEEAIMDIPGVKEVYVIGIPDPLAGERPVAVVRIDPSTSKAQLRNRAFEIGPKFSLEEVYTLAELNLEAVPVTSLNKVKKHDLRQVVLDYARRKEASRFIPSFTANNGSLAQCLMTVWEGLTGHRPVATESITHAGDSILLLRYCDAVFRSCGQRMYLQDVVQHDTIEKQVEILRGGSTSRNAFSYVNASLPDNKVAGTLRIDARQAGTFMSPSTPEPNVTSRFGVDQRQLLAEKREMPEYSAEKELGAFGLSRSVIEDCIPVRHSFHRMVVGQRPQSYHLRMIFRVHHASLQQIIRGMEKALAGHGMLRAIITGRQDGTLGHLIIKPDHQLLDALISTRHVESEVEAQARWKDDSVKKHPSHFMFCCEIISVRTTGSKYISMQYNHSIVDALSLWSWHRDLDRLIEDVNADIAVQTPYKRFSELFSIYEDSSLAKRAVLFHVKRLRGISRLAQALWPVQRAPGWMISNDEGSSLAVERQNIRDQVWGGEWQEKSTLFQYPRLGRIVQVPQIQKLKEHGVEASIFAKCAVFFFNTLRTGSSHAILSTWESGRSWPFVPSWIESTLPPAMSVGGPTAQWILHIVQVFENESVMEYFKRMAGEIRAVERQQHAPWQKIIEELRDEGTLAEDASFRQAFVWDISLGLASSSGSREDMKTLEAITRMDWADCGLFWNAFMIDPDNLYFVASWDTAQMNDIEMGECCDLLADVMRTLGNEENWDRPIASIASELRSDPE